VAVDRRALSGISILKPLSASFGLDTITSPPFVPTDWVVSGTSSPFVIAPLVPSGEVGDSLQETKKTVTEKIMTVKIVLLNIIR
jgi:hypothetical protein